jgi:hypothetical protein
MGRAPGQKVTYEVDALGETRKFTITIKEVRPFRD